MHFQGSNHTKDWIPEVYEVYPQLHLDRSSYSRVNGAFTMYITRPLQGVEHVRIYDKAKELIKKYGAWFI